MLPSGVRELRGAWRVLGMFRVKVPEKTRQTQVLGGRLGVNVFKTRKSSYSIFWGCGPTFYWSGYLGWAGCSSRLF